MHSKIYPGLIFLIVWQVSAQDLVLSEYMGDPNSLPDIQGEYLEFLNVSDSTYTTPELKIILNRDTAIVKNFSLAAKGFYLVCKDSLSFESFGLPCDLQWPRLNITNSSPSTFALIAPESQQTQELAPPLAGQSWENTLWVQQDFCQFTPSLSEAATGDRGTPGAFPVEHHLQLSHDLSIYKNDSTSKINPEVTIRNVGLDPTLKSTVLIWEDQNWDGVPERLLREIALERILPGKTMVLHTDFTGLSEGQSWVVQLEKDQNQANNQIVLFPIAQSPLVLTEVCPDPQEGSSEYIEIYNRGKHPIDLRSIKYNSIPLGGGGELYLLGAGDFLLLTPDAKALQSEFPNLDLPLLELSKWDGLKNTGGDSVVLKAGAITLDKMFYPSLKTTQENFCFIAGPDSALWIPAPNRLSERQLPQTKYSSPGYRVDSAPELKVQVAPEIINRQNPREFFRISVEIPPGQSLDASVFDMQGYLVNPLARNLQSNQVITWQGRDAQGEMLPLGIYILWIASEGKVLLKKPLILAQPL